MSCYPWSDEKEAVINMFYKYYSNAKRLGTYLLDRGVVGTINNTYVSFLSHQNTAIPKHVLE